MKFEDFSSLAEMNNGLTSPSRVRELISVMEKERDLSVKNAVDRTRQRSTVARAIAATENEECLDLFIQLDGLHFISNWLKDARALSNDSNNSFVEEEYITHLFRALEKLHLDYEKSVVFGIRTTVEILVNHKSSEVQDRARVLLESWNKKKDSIDVPLSDVDKSRASTDEETRETSVKDNGHELTRDDQVVSKSSDVVRTEQVESAHEDDNHVSSSQSLPKPTVEPFSPASSRQDILDTDSDFHGLKSKTSEGQPLTSSSDAVAEMEDVTEHNSHNSSSAGSKNPSDEDLSDTDSRAVDSDGKSDSGENPNEITSTGGEKSWGKYLSGIKDYSSDDNLKNDYAFGKKQLDTELDPLEVAMQVAMEVEREHVDYSQQSCSNSPKNLPRSSTPQPNSPVSVKQSPMDSVGATDTATSTKNPVPQEKAVSQITEAVQDEPNTEKIACNFIDLNQEVLVEDSDHHHDPEVKLSAPVSVVSASRASAADPKLPSSPLQFEGNLGWKGSALTSAFRRLPETDFSTGGSSSSNSKQRQGWCLDFDLNVSEFVDDSNVETNSKKSEHLELDLNCMSGDGGSHLMDWQMGNNWSQFPPSIQQPNLNGGPSFLNAKKPSSQNLNIRSNGDSSISIMGTRVEVNRKDFVSQTPELGFDINSGRTGNFTVPYVHSLGYPYSNFVPGPGPTVPFTGPMYGPARPIPYMVDSRGMPVISHMGLSQQPFVINMNGPTPCNGAGQSRGSVDLNSGMFVEGGSKDPPGLGLFLNSTQVRPMGEVSSVGGKRKEPDSGYNDHYYPSKHYTPSHWRQN